MNKISIIIILAIFLGGCGASPQAIQSAVIQTLSALPTTTPYPTYTSAPSSTPIILVVTATLPPFTPMPSNTPTITPTPTKTLTPRPTQDPLKVPHGDGVYLVGVDIAAGVWRSEPGNSDCYWKRDSRTGDIIDNYYGQSGGTIYISPTDFEIHLERCGTWTFLSNP